MTDTQPRRRHDKLRRQHLLEAAATLIAARGIHAVRVSDIAQEVGTTTSNVHYYFPAKDDLLISAIIWAVEQAFARHNAEMKELTSSYERITRLLELQLPTGGPIQAEWSIWLQYWSEASQRAELRATHAEMHQRWHDAIAEQVDAGKRSSEFEAVDTDFFVQQLSSIFNGSALQVLTGTMPVERMRELVMTFVAATLRPRALSSPAVVQA